MQSFVGVPTIKIVMIFAFASCYVEFDDDSSVEISSEEEEVIYSALMHSDDAF